MPEDILRELDKVYGAMGANKAQELMRNVAEQQARDAESGDMKLEKMDVKTDVTEVDASEWGSWDEDGRSWFSVDTPADLRQGRKLFGSPGI